MHTKSDILNRALFIINDYVNLLLFLDMEDIENAWGGVGMKQGIFFVVLGLVFLAFALTYYPVTLIVVAFVMICAAEGKEMAKRRKPKSLALG